MDVVQGRRRDVGIDEHEAAPGVHGDRHERELLAVEVHLARHARRVLEPAVERVRPAVVAALQELAAAVLHRHRVRAVAADVDEAVQLALGVARDDAPGTRPDLADHVVARRGELGLGAEQRPAAREDLARCSSSATLGIGIPAGRQRPAVVEGLGGLVEAEARLLGRSPCLEPQSGVARPSRLRFRSRRPRGAGRRCPGSFVSTAPSRSAACAVPSATVVAPADCAWPPKPCTATRSACEAVFSSAFRIGQSAMPSEPSRMRSVSRTGRGHRARVEVVARERDRARDAAARDRVVDEQAELAAVAVAQPADARRQPRELHGLARGG